MMKTIADAYRELNGELDNTYLFNGDKDMYLFYAKGNKGSTPYSCFTTKVEHEAEQYVCTVDEFINYKGESMKPVFTQEMSDNGELPSVGMGCQGYILAATITQGNPCDKWVEGVFVQESQSPNGGMCFLFKCHKGRYYTLNATSHFKPIDTRTDKEKLFEQINATPRIYIEDVNKLVDDIVNNKLVGVKWVGK